jgi:hypothetical protein
MIRVCCDRCGDDITDNTPDCWPEHQSPLHIVCLSSPQALTFCQCPTLCARCCPTCQETT